MGWEMETRTDPVARKDYHCQASDWICESGRDESEYEVKDWATIKKAKSEDWKILKGTKYVKVSGKYDGDFATFRAREDLEDICQRYEIYSYD